MEIEQIAYATRDIEMTIWRYERDLGIPVESWSRDEVRAQGTVFGQAAENRAMLAFNYDIVPGKEFELLQYLEGRNWHEFHPWPSNVEAVPSHLGYHVDDLAEHNGNAFSIAQEVVTQSHTSLAVPRDRRYAYRVYNSRALLGWDLKLIQRLTIPEFGMSEDAR